MTTLTTVLVDPSKRPLVVDDCVALIDAEVADKSGLSGFAIKAGYGAVKGVKPGFVRHVVDDLLPEFGAALEPMYQEACNQSKSIHEYFSSHAARVADALLSITDAKAQKAKSGLVKGTYEKLRGSAKKNVEAAVPRLGKLIEKHAPKA